MLNDSATLTISHPFLGCRDPWWGRFPPSAELWHPLNDARRASAEQYVGLPNRYHKRSTMALDKPYLDIPGTTVFDTAQDAKGDHLEGAPAGSARGRDAS